MTKKKKKPIRKPLIKEGESSGKIHKNTPPRKPVAPVTVVRHI